MREIRRVVLGFDLLRGGGEGLVEIAVAARNCDVGLRVQPAAVELHQARARNVAVGADVPFDVDVPQRLFCAPPVVCDHRDEALHRQHLDDAAPALDLGRVDRFHLAAEHRALRDRGVEHAGQLNVDAETLLAHHRVGDVDALDGLADQLPVLGIFQFHVFRRLELGRRVGHLSEAQPALARTVRDEAVLSRAFGRRDSPLLRRRGDQHFARGRAGLAQILLGIADGPASDRSHVTPGAPALHVRVRRRIFDLHPSPVAFQLLGDQHRGGGHAALPHLGAGVADDDRIVRADHDPGVDLGRSVGLLRERARETESDGKAAADRRGLLQEFPARRFEFAGECLGHGRPYAFVDFKVFAAAWIAVRMRA